MPPGLPAVPEIRPLAHASLLCALLVASAAIAGLLRAQSPPPQAPSAADLALPPVRWAEVSTAAEEHVINYDHTALLRYRIRKLDDKGETVRQVIESREGSVARLIEKDGRPLTAEDNTAERERLQNILDAPAAFLRHIHREDGSRSYAIELLHAMPRSMLWTYAPGQPQLPGAPGPAVVIDFRPDPAFKPPSLITEGLTGIAGRVWVDAASHNVARIQLRVLHPVDFGWGGMLARVKEGGTVELEQRKAGDRRWLFSRLVEHIFIREVLVHTAAENNDMTATDVEPLPAPISFREAVQQLLAMPVPTR